jgi:hypothetical protein
VRRTVDQDEWRKESCSRCLTFRIVRFGAQKSAEPGHGALLGLIDLSKLLIYINGLCGTAGGIRTTDLLIHSQAL